MLESIQTALRDLSSLHLFDNRLMRISLILAIILLLQLLSHRYIGVFIERVVRSHKYANRIEQHKREATLKTFLRTTVSVVIWILGFIAILLQFEVNFTPLFASAGIIGIVVGISGQSVIKDSLAGMFIILENQLRVDDIVTIVTPWTTISGLVEDVTIRTTRLRDLDGSLHIVTNGSIGVLSNKSYNFAQVNIDVFITYDTDIDLVEKLINEAGKATSQNKLLKDSITEPIAFLRVENLGDTTITLKALGKVKPGTQWEVAGDFRRQLKKLFDQHKIKAPNTPFNPSDPAA